MRNFVVILASFAVIAVCNARIIWVDDDSPSYFNNIQAAIDDANDGDTVLVADGTYTGDGNRDIDFHGKAITVKSENGPENCIIDCNGSEAHKHRGFYFHSEEDACSSVIGFTITKGYPPGECRPIPPFTCAYLGGAIRCKEASPAISHCIIMGNRADKGGGIYLEGGTPRVSQCTIAGNQAMDWGGGIAVSSSDAEISNCIVWGNSAPSGPQIYNSGSGSLTVAYSDVEGCWAGTGNIAADPCFADPNNGDYHLKSQGGRYEPNEGRWTTDEVTSPCIDAGDHSSPVGLEPFPNGGIINIGAYGGTAEASKSFFGAARCETIVAGDVNGDCRVDFSDFTIFASHWLELIPPPGCHGIAVTDVTIYRCEFIGGAFTPQEEVDKVTVGNAFTIQVEVTNFGRQMQHVSCLYGWDLSPEYSVELIGGPLPCWTSYDLEPGDSAGLSPFCGGNAFSAKETGWVTMSICVVDWYGSVLCEHPFIFEIQKDGDAF